jgi:hypothetical protein
MLVTPYVCVAVKKNSFGGAAEKVVYLLSGARNGGVFTESVSGIEGRRPNAAKERSPMIGPNLNEQILAAD